MDKVRCPLTQRDREQIWELWRPGWTLGRVDRHLGRSTGSVQQVVAATGGVRPPVRCRAEGRLTRAEREEISRGLAAGETARSIARRLERAPSTITREIAANDGRRNYRADRADQRAWEQTRRPKPYKLALSAEPLERVGTGLESQWSPEQIAGWLRVEFPEWPEMWVSRETIYVSLFVQAKSLPRKELTAQLRTKRVIRRPARGTARGKGRGQIVDAIPLSERPADVEDRAVPGHWEGDLLSGAGNTHIITLAERSTRFRQLIATPSKRSEDVIDALTAPIKKLPEQLRLSLTWDRGLEMAEYKRFTVDSGVQVYFCDP